MCSDFRASAISELGSKIQPEEIFRLAIDACPIGIALIDGDGRLVLVNAEVVRQFGYQRDEMIGQLIDIFVPKALTRNRGAPHSAQIITEEMSARLGAFGLRKDRSKFPVEVGLNLIPAHDDILVLAVIIDIGERVRIERLKDEFVSTVSHELRTPLTSIAGALGLLAGNAAGTLPAPMARLINIAHSNSQRLVRLVNTILDMEKIESGKVVFALKRVDVRSLVQQTIDLNRGFADDCGVQMRLDATPARAFIYADPDWLIQVVTNLLSNAIKFSPRSGEVVVAIEKLSRTVRITVRDHGHGIPNEFRPRVFEKFAQADATDARQMGGTGLGLAIVKEIVTRLGGTVGFGDASGGGTIFHVELPDWTHKVKAELAIDGWSGPSRTPPEPGLTADQS